MVREEGPSFVPVFSLVLLAILPVCSWGDQSLDFGLSKPLLCCSCCRSRA